MGKTIYTMPEKFMKDESVPVKWRLYGLVNGFWINGLPVYASNGFFAEKLNCTERHISRAFEELEKEGLLTRNINGYKRLILQGGMTPDVRGGGHGASIYPDVGGQPNASSNASNLTISAEGAEERVVKEKKASLRALGQVPAELAAKHHGDTGREESPRRAWPRRLPGRP
jgi:hypothetical protein